MDFLRRSVGSDNAPKDGSGFLSPASSGAMSPSRFSHDLPAPYVGSYQGVNPHLDAGRPEISFPVRDEHPTRHYDSTNPDDEGAAAIETNDELVQHSFGAKKIGWMSSYVYVINQIFGPGVLAIPIVFQQAGWSITTVVLIYFMIVSSLASTCLCEAIRVIPGNHDFSKRIEFSSAVDHYLGPRWNVAFQILLNICLQSINIASIRVVAQSMDSLFTFLWGTSYALEIAPNFHFESGGASIVGKWYGSGGSYKIESFDITLGYVVCMILCIPMGIVNLDDNIKFQWVSFIGLVVLMVMFIYTYIFSTGWYEVPVVDDDLDQLVSVFIFSWTYVMLVPSWVNEKKDEVSVNKTIWNSALLSAVGYVSLGLLAALSFDNLSSDDILARMQMKKMKVVTRVAAYFFSVLIILPGIPVFCITTRYNLLLGGVCGRRMSYFLGVVAPWLIGFVFSQGAVFAAFLSWTSLLVSGFVNFMMPLYLYICSMERYGRSFERLQSIKRKKINPTGPDAQDENQKLLSQNSGDSAGNSMSYGSVNQSITMQTVEIDKYAIQPYPKSLMKYAKAITWACLISVTILTSAQIVIDVYYLIAEGKWNVSS